MLNPPLLQDLIHTPTKKRLCTTYNNCFYSLLSHYFRIGKMHIQRATVLVGQVWNILDLIIVLQNAGGHQPQLGPPSDLATKLASLVFASYQVPKLCGSHPQNLNLLNGSSPRSFSSHRLLPHSDLTSSQPPGHHLVFENVMH